MGVPPACIVNGSMLRWVPRPSAGSSTCGKGCGKACGRCGLSRRAGREAVAQTVKERRKIVQVFPCGLGLPWLRFRSPRGVQPSVPDDDVKPLDLLDQHQDCLAGRRDLSSLIAPEPLRPLAQERELLHIEAAV